VIFYDHDDGPKLWTVQAFGHIAWGLTLRSALRAYVRSLRVRAMVRACDRYIEWCDYMSDARWARYGRALHPMFRLAERITLKYR